MKIGVILKDLQPSTTADQNYGGDISLTIDTTLGQAAVYNSIKDAVVARANADGYTSVVRANIALWGGIV